MKKGGKELDDEALSALLIAAMSGLGILFTIDPQAADFPKAWSCFKNMFMNFLAQGTGETN